MLYCAEALLELSVEPNVLRKAIQKLEIVLIGDGRVQEAGSRLLVGLSSQALLSGIVISDGQCWELSQ
jgi:hypothetical protein